MKNTTLLAIGIALLAVWLGTLLLGTAHAGPGGQHHEYAIIKWDGTDKVCVNLPGKSEIHHVFELSSTRTPKEMQDPNCAVPRIFTLPCTVSFRSGKSGT